jgi:hypothetical protein
LGAEGVILALSTTQDFGDVADDRGIDARRGGDCLAEAVRFGEVGCGRCGIR